jgi:hypothetical protein
MRECVVGLKGCVLCLVLQLMNTLSRKELALLQVQAHPYIPDTIALVEAWEQLGWGQEGDTNQ